MFVVDEDDPTKADYPAEYTHLVASTGCMGGALAAALPDILGDATVVGMLGDDVRIRTPGWDVIFEGWLAEHPGIAWGDDLNQRDRQPSHWWASRSLVDAFGMALPTLRHLYMDSYWQVMGSGAGCLRFFPEVVMEHLHPDVGKAPTDDIYLRGSAPASPNATLDRATFEKWRQKDSARDIRRLNTIIGRNGRGINVLADFHHPALWESLELLCERFGWNLYRPVGREWWDQGYWGFVNLGMKLNWTDLLDPVGPYPEAYPRVKKTLTLAQAKSIGLDYVLTSVWQNQAGFDRLADEVGALFVHQIGNADHPADWTLPARYLVSANMPTHDRPAVTYHQEFDARLFRYEPSKGSLVANFSLRFDWQADVYAQFKAAQALGPDIEWHDYGTLYGELPRMADVADAMRACAFIWHDKPFGDGYGHTIHNAAAVGRPIIGHARYYKGRMAEVFWRDGETAIDLDKHSIPEAVELVRAILADKKRHRAMCEAMHETFLANVDFDEDARRVKALLTGPPKFNMIP